MGRQPTPGVVIRRRRRYSLPEPLARSQAVRDLFNHAAARGLSMGSLLDLTGYSHVSLSRWRNGRTSPAIGDLDNLARALGGRIVFEKGEGL